MQNQRRSSLDNGIRLRFPIAVPGFLGALIALDTSRRKVGSHQRCDSRSQCPASLDALALLGTSRRKVRSHQRYIALL
jgi:hypothetical protein